MNWRYEVVYVDVAKKERLKSFKWLSSEEVKSVLDQWGKKGWELVSVLPATTWRSGIDGIQEDLMSIMAVFKKPISSGQDQ